MVIINNSVFTSSPCQVPTNSIILWKEINQLMELGAFACYCCYHQEPLVNFQGKSLCNFKHYFTIKQSTLGHCWSLVKSSTNPLIRWRHTRKKRKRLLIKFCIHVYFFHFPGLRKRWTMFYLFILCYWLTGTVLWNF